MLGISYVNRRKLPFTVRFINITIRDKTIAAQLILQDRKEGNIFYMHHPTDRIAHTTAFVTPVVEHWLQREIAKWVYHEGSIRQYIAP